MYDRQSDKAFYVKYSIKVILILAWIYFYKIYLTYFSFKYIIFFIVVILISKFKYLYKNLFILNKFYKYSFIRNNSFNM